MLPQLCWAVPFRALSLLPLSWVHALQSGCWRVPGLAKLTDFTLKKDVQLRQANKAPLLACRLLASLTRSSLLQALCLPPTAVQQLYAKATSDGQSAQRQGYNVERNDFAARLR